MSLDGREVFYTREDVETRIGLAQRAYLLALEGRLRGTISDEDVAEAKRILDGYNAILKQMVKKEG